MSQIGALIEVIDVQLNGAGCARAIKQNAHCAVLSAPLEAAIDALAPSNAVSPPTQHNNQRTTSLR